jgi:hypothetical protein
MTGTVTAGRFVLELGAPPGTLISSGAQPEVGDPRPLRRAFKKGGDRRLKKTASGRLADDVDKASVVTARAERAVALFRGLVQGNVLDPKLLSDEIDSLLNLIERLHHGGRSREALRVARALSGVLALSLRWVELVRSLNIALQAADKLGDPAAGAWARHELGTLHLAAEDAAGAERRLGEAREMRQRIPDRRGLTATDRNLQVLCQHVRQQLRDGRLVRRRAVLRAALAVAVALLLVAGASTAVIASGDGSEAAVDPPPPAECNNAKDDDGDGFTDGNDRGCGDGTEAPTNQRPSSECNDGRDNDGDQLMDRSDPGCTSADDDDESNTAPAAACADGTDNDGDALVDLRDPGCRSADDDDESNTAPAAACADGTDNDGDGLVDLRDPGCPSAVDDDESDPVVDDDGDGVPNPPDNCPELANPGQEDADGDGVGDVCESAVD